MNRLVHDILHITSDVFLYIFIQFIWIDRSTVFENNMCFLDLWKIFSKISAVLFMEIGTIGHPVFVAILKAPSLNGSIVNSSPLLRVLGDTDGNALLYIINCLQDCFQSFLWILSVEEETIDETHPGGKKRNFFPFLFSQHSRSGSCICCR